MYSTGSFLELLTAAMAWHLYGELWSLLVRSGLAYLPFAALILLSLREARAHSAAPGSSGGAALQKAELRLYPAFAVVLLALVPAVAVSPRELVFAEQSCVLSRSDLQRKSLEHRQGDSGTTYDEVRLDGITPRVPIWWWLLNNLSRGLSAEAINALPCTVDLRRLSADVTAGALRDPLLRMEYLRFGNECWRPAYRRFLSIRQLPETAPGERPISDDITWVGSRHFLQTPGYYDRLYPSRGVQAFPYLATRDAVFAAPEFAADGGWPNCRDWWSEADRGLRGRLLAAVDGGLLGRWYHRFTQTPESADRLLFRLLRGDQELRGPVVADNLAAPGAFGAVQELGLNLLGGFGLVRALPETAAIFKVVRDSAPVIQALILMVLVVVLPLLLASSAYSIGALLLLSFAFFSVNFWSFIFKLVFWLDNTLSDALFGDEWLGQAVALPFRVVFQTLIFSLYIALPVLFTGWMASAGSGIGSGIANLLGTGLLRSPAQASGAGARSGGGKR